jgi:endonuclease/exonuclease/phosphatase family metal-dependent hydrolase
LLLFWSHFLFGFPFLPRVPAGNANSHSFRVMSYNIERGAGGISALERAIRSQEPDIICLQESQGVNHHRAFTAGDQLAGRFPRWHAAQSGDVMTLSRFPLRSERDYPLRGTRRILETTWQTPRGPVRVLNVHVATSVTAQPQVSRGKFGRILGVIKNAQPAAQARMEQIGPLQRAIGASDAELPLIVAGDFNSPRAACFSAPSAEA